MPLDRTNIRSMLGLRFRDAVTERPVADGLRVSVRRADGVGRPVEAVQTVSGAFVAQGLPGLRGYERSNASVQANAVSYFVAVRDERSRFAPVLLQVELPKPGQSGLYPIVETPADTDAETAPDEEPEPACYLFPSVSRPVPPGHAVVYADLVYEDTTDDGDRVLKPASHAVLQVKHAPGSNDSNGSNSSNGNASNGNASNGNASNGNASNGGGRTYYGIADERGRVAVQFPIPPVQLEELKVPPGKSNTSSGNASNGNASSGNASSGNASSNGSGRPLSARTWPLEIRARYDALDAPRSADRPLLTDVLQQGFRDLYESHGGNGKQVLKRKLEYGRPLTPSTTGLPNDRTALRIDPAP